MVVVTSKGVDWPNLPRHPLAPYFDWWIESGQANGGSSGEDLNVRQLAKKPEVPLRRSTLSITKSPRQSGVTWLRNPGMPADWQW
jgi:hypothetical protein